MPCQYVTLLKLPNFDAANIKWFTIINHFLANEIFQLALDRKTSRNSFKSIKNHDVFCYPLLNKKIYIEIDINP